MVDGQKAFKPGQLVAEDARLEVLSRPRYVSRGGLKLEAALARVRVDRGGEGLPGYRVIHGRVYGLPAAARGGAGVRGGRGNGAAGLEAAERPARGGARESERAASGAGRTIGELADLLVCDVSFISVTLMLPAVARAAEAGRAKW